MDHIRADIIQHHFRKLLIVKTQMYLLQWAWGVCAEWQHLEYICDKVFCTTLPLKERF